MKKRKILKSRNNKKIDLNKIHNPFRIKNFHDTLQNNTSFIKNKDSIIKKDVLKLLKSKNKSLNDNNFTRKFILKNKFNKNKFLNNYKDIFKINKIKQYKTEAMNNLKNKSIHNKSSIELFRDNMHNDYDKFIKFVNDKNYNNGILEKNLSEIIKNNENLQNKIDNKKEINKKRKYLNNKLIENFNKLYELYLFLNITIKENIKEKDIIYIDMKFDINPDSKDVINYNKDTNIIFNNDLQIIKLDDSFVKLVSDYFDKIEDSYLSNINETQRLKIKNEKLKKTFKCLEEGYINDLSIFKKKECLLINKIKNLKFQISKSYILKNNKKLDDLIKILKRNILNSKSDLFTLDYILNKLLELENKTKNYNNKLNLIKNKKYIYLKFKNYKKIEDIKNNKNNNTNIKRNRIKIQYLRQNKTLRSRVDSDIITKKEIEIYFKM